MTQRFLITLAIIITVLLCHYSVRAQDRQFGDWSVTGNGTIAKTVNDSHEEFVRACGGGTCTWAMNVAVSCTEGGDYNVLVNSDTGNANTTVTCFQTSPRPVYSFKDSNLISGLLEQATQVSVAVPLGNGLIRVSRFSLRGMREAVAQLGGNQAPPNCAQLSANYNTCKAEAEGVLKKCAVWHGPGKCPYTVPLCKLPSNIDSRCRP